jgi:hypothetical protein
METKPRLVEVTRDEEMSAEEFETMLAQHNRGDLSHPYILTSAGLPGRYWADADELKRWRRLRESQNQSEGESK